MTQNQIQFHSLEETKRHQREDESIRKETNRINYELGKRNAAVNERNAETNVFNANENQRTHKVNESLGYLNYANERNKLPATYLSAYGAYLRGISGMSQAEAALQNAATNAGMLVETHRSNLVNEGIKQQQQDEYERNNKFINNLDNLKAVTSYSTNKTNANVRQNELFEQNRHNEVWEAETKRNNLINQQLESTKQLQTINRDKYNVWSEMLKNLTNGIHLSVSSKGGLN